MSRILALDPGLHTGAAIFDVWGDERDGWNHWQVEGGVHGIAHFLKNCGGWDVMVCEAFNLDGRTPKPDLTPVEVIGYLKGTYSPIQFVTPATHKPLITDAVLKRAGYYPKRGEVKGGHSTDAIRIALWYLVKQQKDTFFINKLWPKD